MVSSRPNRGEYRGAAALLVLCAALVSPRNAAAQSRSGAHLNRARQAEALANGEVTVEVLVAAHLGRAAPLVDRIRQLGGLFKVRVDTVAYLRAELPVGAVETLAASADVEALNIGAWSTLTQASAEVDPSGVVGNSVQKGTLPESARAVPPGPITAPENPYLPAQEIGAPQFIRAHPTYDGRGVTIAAVDEFVDLAHPALQRAVTLDGQPVRKIAGLYAAGLLGDLGDAILRLTMDDTVRALGQGFVYNGTHFRAPYDARFRIGRYDRRWWPIFSSQRRPDWPFPTQVQLDSLLRWELAERPDNNYLTILWDEAAGRLWVDTNHDDTFVDETPFRDYNGGGNYLLLGHRAAQPYDTRLPFAVTTDPVDHQLFVWLGGEMHGTAVAGIAAGNGLYGGAANGVAPNARVVAVLGHPIEAFIMAAQRPEVDILTSETGYVMRLHDGGSVTSLILSRLVAIYHKPIFVSNGNDGPGVSSPDEIALGDGVIAVGGAISRATWSALFGERTHPKMSITNMSARGPRADGGMNPIIVAPACAAAPVPPINHEWVKGHNEGAFQPLYGYQVGCGTSYAAPMAAGAGALLVSAAKQAGVPYDATSIREALIATARPLSEYEAADQGAGLIDVRRAWDYLREHAKARRAGAAAIEVAAPVGTTLSGELGRPGSGVGLNEREGWAAGDTGTRVITLMRATGAAGAQRFDVRWALNDGTFRSARTVALPLHQPVRFPVRIVPRMAGAHSAYIDFVDRRTRTVAQRVMTTVIAADQPAGPPGHQVTHRGLISWLRSASTFIAVPPGSRRLNLTVVVNSGGRLQLRYHDPTGMHYPSTGSVPDSATVPCDSANRCYFSGQLRRVLRYPEPGTWEIVLFNEDMADSTRRFRSQQPIAYTLTASLDLEPERWGGDEERPIERLAFDTAGGMAVREIQVDSGATRLAVRIGHASDAVAQVDVYLFDCTGAGEKPCARVTSAPYAGAHKTVIVDQPKPGLWKAVLDPFRLPSGSVTLDYAVTMEMAKFVSGQRPTTEAEPR
jgi:subtilisin family serine protease